MEKQAQLRAFKLTRIAETGGRLSGFDPYVASVNDAGMVAFQAGLSAGGSGAFFGRGGPISEAVDPGGDLSGVYSHPDINLVGDLCFYGTLKSGAQGVFSSSEGRTTPLAVTGGEFRSIGPLGPTMNDRGAVAFRGTLSSGADGVFMAAGGSVAKIADTTDAIGAFHGLPVVNAGGTVLFRADLREGPQGIYASRGGSLSTVVETGDQFSELGHFPTVNDAGTVAFAAALRSGGSGVFAAKMRKVTPLVADAEGLFESFRGALINGAGLVAFLATPRGGRLGIFGGPDPAACRIICLGDPLLGSTVEDFALNPVSVNEAAQLAVRVALADGRQAILRVDPAA